MKSLVQMYKDLKRKHPDVHPKMISYCLIDVWIGQRMMQRMSIKLPA